MSAGRVHTLADVFADDAVREATEDDLPRLAETLAGAFADYAWTGWIVDPSDHPRRLRELYSIYLGVALRFGRVWTTADASAGAAWTWTGHGAAIGAYMERAGLDVRVAELAGDRAGAAAQADAALEPLRPAEAHWRLEAVGVVPAHQGQGLGTRVLTPGLEVCDAGGATAALETSARGNVRLYERLGFRVQAELQIPDGPHVWHMRRAPRAVSPAGGR